jgi:hypothetical protein
MKRLQFLFLCIVCSIYCFGQIKVNSIGNLGIGTTNPANGKLEIAATGVSNGITLTPGGGIASMRLYFDGSYSYLTRGGSNDKGIQMNSNGDIRLKSVTSSAYASAFKTIVNHQSACVYNLNYGGQDKFYVCAEGWLWTSQGGYIGSDSTLKENIIPISESLQKITKLKAVQYNYKPTILADTDSIQFTTKKSDIIKQKRIGLLAQDVEKVFPEVVKTMPDGMKAISYTDLIPVLIQALQEQQAIIHAQSIQIKNIENKIDICCITQEKPKLKSETRVQSEIQDQTKAQAELQQNKPNPFTQNTVIDMYIPQDVQQATVYVYDLKGTQILKLPVFEREQIEITIQAQQLKAGMYIYSLVTDGVLVGSKQMIVTE